jgi:hypothetical protein
VQRDGKDGWHLDRELDRRPADKPWGEQLVPTPCGPNAISQQVYSSSMIACGGSAQVDQCSAAPLCNLTGGWHLCTATEFRARSGTITATSSAAWIASCARNNGKDYTNPTDSICASCSTATDRAYTVATWDCQTGQTGFTSNLRQLGMISSGLCHRAGSNLAANEAYWTTYGAGSYQLTSLCCK